MQTSEVHVWRTRLDVTRPQLERLSALLDVNERLRASKFLVASARSRYIVARGFLRQILAGYLDVEPERLAFKYNGYGKPTLDGDFSRANLQFNLSHAGAFALYAVTRGRDVGVDIEECSTSVSTSRIAEQFFSPIEVAALKALPADCQSRAFFACWTRKEAFVKARGRGLSLPLNAFSVSVVPGEPAQLLTAQPPSEVDRWSMSALSVGAGYEAAVVAEGRDWRLRYQDWEARLADCRPMLA